MTKGEYKTFTLTLDMGMLGNKEFDSQQFDEKLKRLGDAGWELISLSVLTANGWSRQIVATLKKPRTNP